MRFANLLETTTISKVVGSDYLSSFRSKRVGQRLSPSKTTAMLSRFHPPPIQGQVLVLVSFEWVTKVRCCVVDRRCHFA